MLNLARITGGALVARVKANPFVMVRIVEQTSRLFNIRQRSQKQSGSVPVNKLQINPYVMEHTQNCNCRALTPDIDVVLISIYIFALMQRTRSIVACTIFFKYVLTSDQQRFFNPQSGFIQSCSAAIDSCAVCIKRTISDVSIIPGE